MSTSGNVRWYYNCRKVVLANKSSGPEPLGRKPVQGREIIKRILVVTSYAFRAFDWSILILKDQLSRPAVKLSSVDRPAVTKFW